MRWFGHVKRIAANKLLTKVLHCNIKGKRNRGRQPKIRDRQYKGRSESEEYGHQGCSGGDSGQREVEMDCTASLSANLTDEKQNKEEFFTLVWHEDMWVSE